MLQSMRQLAHSWVFKGLMLLLVISFGIWGIGDMFRGNPLHRVAAKAGADTITTQELNHAFEQNLARAREMFGSELTPAQAKQMGLADNALNDLIENSLFTQELNRLGIDAGDPAVLRLLMSDKQLKDKDGHFDKRILFAYLQRMRISEGEFMVQQRKEIAARQLADIFATLPPASPLIVDNIYKTRGQKHVFDIVTLANSSAHVNDADEKTLRDYYTQHPQPFTVPETRGITIAVLSTDAIAKDILISDDQVKKEYDDKHDQLKEPEKRDLLQVILQDEGKAKSLAAAARKSGIVTAAKATSHEVMPLNGADEAGALPEIAKPVFALPLNGVTDPIQTALGWHVIQVRKITPPGVPPYEAVKDKLRESMKANQAADTASRLVNQLDDELAAGHSLEDVADGMKLRMIKIAALDVHGKLPDGKDPAELPHKEDVLKAAFAQNSGETSPVMDDRNGTYYVVRVDSVTPAAPKPFEQVKNDVQAAWKKEEQQKQAAIDAEAIAKELRDGKPAASMISHAGVDVRLSKPISQLGDTDPSVPVSLLPQMLKLKKGEVTVLPQDDKHLIVRLAEMTSAPAEKDEMTAGKITGELNNAFPKELGDQYGKYLHVIYPVTIHQDALDSIAQQGG